MLILHTNDRNNKVPAHGGYFKLRVKFGIPQSRVAFLWLQTPLVLF